MLEVIFFFVSRETQISRVVEVLGPNISDEYRSNNRTRQALSLSKPSNLLVFVIATIGIRFVVYL